MSQHHKEELDRMFKELTDEEIIAANKRKAERERRIEEKRRDTGVE